MVTMDDAERDATNRSCWYAVSRPSAVSHLRGAAVSAGGAGGDVQNQLTMLISSSAGAA
jgi:hypothetical protein